MVYDLRSKSEKGKKVWRNDSETENDGKFFLLLNKNKTEDPSVPYVGQGYVTQN